MFKKILLISALSVCSFAQDKLMYSSVVKPVYLDLNSKKVVAKLLPTNGIEILEKQGDMVKFSIKGYQNPKVPNVIYAKDGYRILALAFAKTANPKIKIIKKGKGDGWNEVSTIAYTTDSDLSDNDTKIMDDAKKLYETNCSMCHALHKPTDLGVNQWPSIFKGMMPRTPITKEQSYGIIQYLQKNSLK